MIAIYKKELRAYFTSMIGWIFLAFFFLGIVTILVLVWLKSRSPYIAWVTGEATVQGVKIEFSKNRRNMS